MHFDQRIESKRVFGDRAHFLERGTVEDRGDQKHGVGAGAGRFVNLDRVKNEILVQDGQSRAGPNGNEIVDRTIKVFYVGQNGDGARAPAFIAAGDFSGGQIRA